MSRGATVVLAVCLVAAGGELLDRIAVVVGNHVVKDSDIDRDLRVTAFLNDAPLDLSVQARKQSASRLIDQTLIRREIEIGQYAEGTPEEAQKMLARIRRQRFRSDAAYRQALAKYGITEAQLKRQLTWQTTVLHFIDQRFRPGVMISDDDIRKYFQSHEAALRQQAGKSVSLDEERDRIEQQLAGERVNDQLFAWLDQTRKEAQIEYHEAELK